MNEYESRIKDVNKLFTTADHLLYSTYPLIRDPKLFMLVAENLYLALIKAMELIIKYDMDYKRIPIIKDDFDHKFETFKEKVVRRYQFNPEICKVILELQNLIKAKNNSTMNFNRADKFIIYSNNQTKMINQDLMKKHI